MTTRVECAFYCIRDHEPIFLENPTFTISTHVQFPCDFDTKDKAVMHMNYRSYMAAKMTRRLNGQSARVGDRRHAARRPLHPARSSASQTASHDLRFIPSGERKPDCDSRPCYQCAQYAIITSQRIAQYIRWISTSV